MLLDGLHIPITTPFHPNGSLSLRKLESNVARYSLTPAAGLLVLGPNSEAETLTDAETEQVLATALRAAAPEKVMLAAIPRAGVSNSLALAATAANLHYDAIVLTAPSTKPAQTLLYLQIIADQSALPVILCSTPERELPLETIAQLAQHPNVIGLVESTSRTAQIRSLTAHIHRAATVTHVFAAVTARMLTQQANSWIKAGSLEAGGTATATTPTLRTRTRDIGFQILAGTTSTIYDALESGAAGAIPALAACCPQATYEIYAAYRDGDHPLAAEKQHHLASPSAHIESHGAPALKYAADLNAYYGGTPRLPQVRPDVASREQIDELLRAIKS
jgi:4-hydroxy-2-oxoglutarate aldolase